MTIERMTDRNNTWRMMGVTLMSDLQRTFVSDRIADLEREAAAIRAERARDRAGLAGGVDPGSPSPAIAARRVRVGRWLVAAGQRIAGARPAPAAAAPALTAPGVADDDPCGDGHDRLAPAA